MEVFVITYYNIHDDYYTNIGGLFKKKETAMIKAKELVDEGHLSIKVKLYEVDET